MYSEERKLHWEVRMTSILGKLDSGIEGVYYKKTTSNNRYDYQDRVRTVV
jgi:hypothetical protein